MARPFKIPGGKLVSLLGALSSLGLMLSMPWDSWLRLFIWLALGLALYFGYGAAEKQAVPFPLSSRPVRGSRLHHPPKRFKHLGGLRRQIWVFHEGFGALQ